MPHHHRFYIHGRWVAPTGNGLMSVINPATEEAVATIAAGGPVDVDRAVAAARRAFAGFARTSGENRLDLLGKIIAIYRKRADELSEAISTEMGAPLVFARELHVPAGLGHLTRTIKVLKPTNTAPLRQVRTADRAVQWGGGSWYRGSSPDLADRGPRNSRR